LHFQAHVFRALLFALTMSLTACGPEQPHGGRAGHVFGMRHGLGLMTRGARLGMRGMRQRGFRQACAGDVTRLCPNAKTRRDERQCLEGKQTSLGSECKAALERRREPGHQ
jgi:hypothetical protein